MLKCHHLWSRNGQFGSYLRHCGGKWCQNVKKMSWCHTQVVLYQGSFPGTGESYGNSRLVCKKACPACGWEGRFALRSSSFTPAAWLVWLKKLWFSKAVNRNEQTEIARWGINIWAMSWENLFMPYANNKEADQPAHPLSLISAIVVHYLDSKFL